VRESTEMAEAIGDDASG